MADDTPGMIESFIHPENSVTPTDVLTTTIMDAYLGLTSSLVDLSNACYRQKIHKGQLPAGTFHVVEISQGESVRHGIIVGNVAIFPDGSRFEVSQQDGRVTEMKTMSLFGDKEGEIANPITSRPLLPNLKSNQPIKPLGEYDSEIPGGLNLRIYDIKPMHGPAEKVMAHYEQMRYFEHLKEILVETSKATPIKVLPGQKN